MGKFNSFEEINSWQKSRIFNKKFTSLLKVNFLKKTLILSGKYGEPQFRFHQILQKVLNAIQIRNLYIFSTLQKHRRVKFVPNYI